MLAKVLTIVALCGLVLIAGILVQAQYQQRKAERLLARAEQIHQQELAAREARDGKFVADKAKLDHASAELQEIMLAASNLADQRIAEASGVSAKRQILQDKLKMLEILRDADDIASSSMVALAEDRREKGKQIRQFAKRFER